MSGKATVNPAWIFSAPEGPRSAWSVIAWWETRRIAYNLILAAVGIPSLVLFYLFVGWSGAVPPGEDAVEPIMLILGPILANIAYTAGWLVEVPAHWLAPRFAERLGPHLFKLGLGFSVLMVSLPTVIWAVVLVTRLAARTM